MNKRQKKKIVWLPDGKTNTCKRASYKWIKLRKRFLRVVKKIAIRRMGLKTIRGMRIEKWLK